MRTLNSSLLLVILLGATSWAVNPVRNSTQNPASFDEKLRELKSRTVLSAEDAKTYSADLTGLVGSYFYIDDDGAAQRIGRPDAIPKAMTIQLKEKIEYQDASEKATEVGLQIPYISALFRSERKTSLTVQDLASVIGTSDPKTIQANLPEILPPYKTVWFISGATVTLVSATQYSNRSFEGSTVIKLGGTHLHVKNLLQNAWIISINKVPAKLSGEKSLLERSLAGKVLKFKAEQKNVEPKLKRK